jgi:nicotinate phosphoribosyltransferase
MYHESLIDTDTYKFSMQQGYMFKYPNIRGRYGLIVRDGREFPEGFGDELRRIVNEFRGIRLAKGEKDFLREKCYYLSPAYLDFLYGYSYDPSEVTIKQDGSRLSIFAEGYLYRTTLWEVPLMATISELYFQSTKQVPFPDAPAGTDVWETASAINRKKAEDLADLDVYYSEFGTRRRYSSANQDRVINDLNRYGRGHMLGTSNMYYAMKYNLIPMGTIAHEWYMMHGALFGYTMANLLATDAWIDVYKGDLGTALPDTYTTDVFLKTFSTKYAKLHDGLRQDSNDPIAFLNKAEARYKELRVSPLMKMILFSDNLNSIEKIARIKAACTNRVIDRYGIGTWFTHDLGLKPMNMVIKLLAVDAGNGWINTVKLSDDLSKNTGDGEEVSLCKKVLGIYST